MRRYGQFCAIARAAELFCERWTPLILRDLSRGVCRFSDLQRGVPLASPTVVSRRLKQLEKEGVVFRRKSASGRRWTYHLTDAGKDLAPIAWSLGAWNRKWSSRDLPKREIDLGLLLWAMEHTAKPEAFGGRRTVVELSLTDQVEKRRHWWFLNEGDHCELCIKPPGQEIDLFLETSLPEMIRVWRGDVKLSCALDTGRLRAHGKNAARLALSRWLGVSPLAHVQSVRADVLAV